ncbi:probable serine/threonine-protein kinase At1g54610 [Humulus lupulus]|uniref:probable serine/threonine-protein kinase At1g54610 n=1 Tax=Humulus lupulus TaxID=3486 RepID=UPI002B408E9B|nr:probable serine/threonine-protein kinase At1g54610 [Humulus lupulus]
MTMIMTKCSGLRDCPLSSKNPGSAGQSIKLSFPISISSNKFPALPNKFLHFYLLLCHLVSIESFLPAKQDRFREFFLRLRLRIMGCVQAKHDDSPTQTRGSVQRLKEEYGYAGGSKTGDGSITGKQVDKVVVFQTEGIKMSVVDLGGGAELEKETSNGGSNRSISKKTVKKNKKKNNIGGDELVNGWPKWLVDNIAPEVLAGMIPKSADSYDKLAKIGHGTYSNVYKARDRRTRRIVALKKVRFDTSEPESIKFMAREIMILRKLDHPNVIKLEGLATSRMQYSLYLVFDFMQADLTKVISRSGQKLNEAQVKCYMQQLLSGLHHCHEVGILHRDIKSSNLLVDKSGRLKIADFGLANFFPPKPKCHLTSRVVTLWYRAPELLLGSTDYGVGIDLWSAGCLLVEMFIGRPFLPGRTEVEQLHKIFKLCGAPSDDYWKKMKLPTSFRPPQHYKPTHEEVFRNFPYSSYGLLTQLLALDPACRGTAASALQSNFFCASPLACELSALPVIYTEENEATQTKDKKPRNSRSKKLSQTDHKARRQELLREQARRANEPSNKETNFDQPNMYSQDTGNSASSSTSSTNKQTKEENQMIFQTYLSPILKSHQKIFARSEAHPKGLKNINLDILKNMKNLTLLEASVTDIMNPKEGSALAQYFRSLSALDFRNRDPEISDISFGSERE